MRTSKLLRSPTKAPTCQPFTVEVEINVAASLALILVTTLHWLRSAVRSLAMQARVLMHDTAHSLIFGGAQVWALGTVDVPHHGHRIAPSIVKEGFEGFDVSIERRSALNKLHIFHKMPLFDNNNSNTRTVGTCK